MFLACSDRQLQILDPMPDMAYVGRFDGTNAKHASPAMAAAGAGVAGAQNADVTSLPTSTKWSVLSSRIEGLAMEMCQVVGGMDAYCVSMSNAEGPAMKAVREKMLATNWAEEWENKRTMFSYGEEMSTDPLEAMMLKQFVHMAQPKRILEVGMFVGFGATAMMEGSSIAKVVSLEIDPYLKKWLSDCLEKFPDFLKRHEVKVGPALESLPKLTGQFDMVFVDANKAEYKRYVEVMLERDLIAPGGTIICDNVLYNGYPYLSSHFDAQPARRGFGNDIQVFNEWVCNHPELEQVVLPIRDGVSILRKKPVFSFSPEPRTASDDTADLDLDTVRKLYMEEKKKNESQAAELTKLQAELAVLRKEGASEKAVVLHVCGSTASEYYEGVSTYYGSECIDAVQKQEKYLNLPCFVHLNGTWSFPTDISEETRAKTEHLTFPQAMQKIADLKPSAIVPHMFCLPGMTSFRALFDTMSIPIVGNAADVMALSTDKWKTKAVVAAGGVKVPHAEVLRKGDKPTLKPPFLLKPCNEDNSQGISLVRPGNDVQQALDLAFSFDSEVLCEEYVPLGRELRVAGLEMEDGSLRVLPCIEYFLSEQDPIRTAQHKLVTNEKGVPTTVATGGRKCPADIDDVLAGKLQDMVERSHKALGCRDYSLYDVRVDPDGEPYFIEACLYCSFAPKSVIVAMGASVGLEQRTT